VSAVVNTARVRAGDAVAVIGLDGLNARFDKLQDVKAIRQTLTPNQSKS
jgi:Zn-dependent alcohol dehydrogenase